MEETPSVTTSDHRARAVETILRGVTLLCFILVNIVGFGYFLLEGYVSNNADYFFAKAGEVIPAKYNRSPRYLVPVYKNISMCGLSSQAAVQFSKQMPGDQVPVGYVCISVLGNPSIHFYSPHQTTSS